MANIDLSGTIHQELQSKVITERITLLETCMGNLCENFGKIARKNARLRDTSDHLITVINEYSGKEKINSSSKKGLVNFSSYLSAVEDYRNAMIERVERKIILPISKYQEYLKSSRKTIKSTIAVRDKEKQKQQKLNQLMQRQPDDGRNIAQAEANAESAAQKVFSQDKLLTEEIDKLEEKKLNDMRNLLKEYTHIQLIFHARALEMLSIAYEQLVNIDVDSDLDEFRNAFTQSTLKSLIGSKQSLNTTNKNPYDSMFSGAGGSLPTTPKSARNSDLHNSRSKSNENIKKGLSQFAGQNNSTTSKNMKSYYSAPHLNDSNNSSRLRSQLDVEDLSDDSDAE